MVSCELYDCDVPDLFARRAKAKKLTLEYNTTIGYENDLEKRQEHLKKLFGKVGPNCIIEPPLQVDYGENTEIGKNFYANFNCVILDCAKVIIGDNVLLAPGVQIYPATHPLDVETRHRKGLEMAHPITIGSDVWIGGNAIILDGVTIGDGAVVGAGSVVTKDVAPNTVVAGNPARVLRTIAN
ncbi:unnamed protein product [Chondrus crispus]|uniref:Maltose/galactoside acetyltransferase domain-containing protein n=1 Tax=Chondrus crispus TaxID=2769 RepID=R7QB56_CHOCR|nr:unnamed protein product [Chondrus crispus]CDF35752.1 unnamed protein product [Chondrus crispus]|eukprot:XP_005715571.1 unnamed protein product [Chondrus crispus]